MATITVMGATGHVGGRIAERLLAEGHTVRALGRSPEKLAANGRELYAWCPDGMQDSRLMKTLGKPGLAGTATVRNWATVNKLDGGGKKSGSGRS